MEHEETKPRYHGKYMGYVRDAADPEGRGRLRVFCPEVVGGPDGPNTWLDWALPSFPWFAERGTGLNFIPPARDAWGVWVEFRHGDPRFPIWTGVFPLTKINAKRAVLASTDKILLGLDADQQAVLGTDYRSAEDTLLTGDTVSLLKAFDLLQAAAIGPLAALKPGFLLAQAALTVFKTASSASNKWLSNYVYVKKEHD